MFAMDIPHVKLSRGSDRVNYYVTTGRERRRNALIAATNITHALLTFGVNDLSAGRTYAQIKADILTAAARLRDQGIKVFQTTITPSSTSSDSFATLANQTPFAQESVRVETQHVAPWRPLRAR